MNRSALLRCMLLGGLLATNLLPVRGQGVDLAAGVEVVSSDPSGLVLQVSTPEYQIDTLENGQQSLRAAGAQVITQPGAPALPVYSALVAVPPGAQIRLEIMSEQSLILNGTFPLQEASPLPLGSPLGEPLAEGEELPSSLPSFSALQAFQPYPSAAARVAEEAWLGGLRLARLEFFPFQVLPASGQLAWHPSLRVAVIFDPPAGAPAGAADALQPGAAPSRPYDALLQGQVLNLEQAQSWTATPQALPMFPAIPTTPSGPRTRIVVEQDGLYRLTAADLSAAGYNLATLDPRKLHLYNQGREVAILIRGEADGRFNSGDQLLFYGEKLRGDTLAARYAVQDDTWPLLGLGWQPQFKPIMIEKYTRQNVYWLAVESSNGLRMGALPQIGSGTLVQSNPATVRAEQSNRWWTWHFTSEDTWLWDRIMDYSQRSYPISLPDPYTGAGTYTATVRGEVVARTASPLYNPDHHTLVKFNNAYLIEDAYWEGLSRHTFQGSLPLSGLNNGANSLQFQGVKDAYPGEVSMFIYFDWFEVTYERWLSTINDRLAFTEDAAGNWHYQTFGFNADKVYALDVSNPLAPAWAQLTNTGGLVEFKVSAKAGSQYYLAGSSGLLAPVSVSAYTPPDLLSASNGADYIIITIPEFAGAAQRLAAHRQAQGLQTRIVLFQDLVNQFNEGIYHPLAIKSFLSYAYTHWNPAPSFAVLIGDGHFNFLDDNLAEYGSSSAIYLPPNLEFVDFTNGEIDATNNLANIVGTDALADLSIGRIPVNNVAQLDVVIDKILAYENGPLNQPWQRRVMLLADNYPDSAGNFPVFSDDLADNYIPAPFLADKIYLDDLGCPVGSSAGGCPQVSTAIVDGLNNPGALFLSFIGHGAVDSWTSEDVMTTEIATTTTNLASLPVSLSMTCYSAYWSMWNSTYQEALEETLLLNPNGGSVAGFGPTGWGTTYDHHLMERGLFQAVFTNRVDRLGLATDLGKLALFNAGTGRDVMQTFLVIGDPALRLHLPPRAEFTATPTNGVAPATVSFTNLSTGDYTSLTWNFGDGSPVSQATNPTHTYTREGVYTVTLTVSDGAGTTDSEVKTGYIRITVFKILLPIVLR